MGGLREEIIKGWLKADMILWGTSCVGALDNYTPHFMMVKTISLSGLSPVLFLFFFLISSTRAPSLMCLIYVLGYAWSHVKHMRFPLSVLVVYIPCLLLQVLFCFLSVSVCKSSPVFLMLQWFPWYPTSILPLLLPNLNSTPWYCKSVMLGWGWDLCEFGGVPGNGILVV